MQVKSGVDFLPQPFSPVTFSILFDESAKCLHDFRVESVASIFIIGGTDETSFNVSRVSASDTKNKNLLIP